MAYLYAVQMLIPDHPFYPIKVGFTNEPVIRKTQYGSGPYPCEWLGAWPGTVEDERNFHQRFKAHRLAGEWFQPTEEMLRAVRTRIRTHKEQMASPAVVAAQRARQQRALRVLGDYAPGPEVA